MMQINNFQIDETFPAVITPITKPDFAECIDQLTQHKHMLERLLLQHGALLFRGFPLQDSTHFSAVIESLGLGQFQNYIGGDSPRDKIAKKIYTSTEAPPKLHIPLHQELSFMKYAPRHIYFFCETAAPIGGATIIGNARQIYSDLHPEVKARFQSKGLTYTSRYYHTSKIMACLNRFQRSHKSWTEVFETQNKSDVEAKCIKHEFDWRWLARDWLEIKQTRPAILRHPETQEAVWFNQAHLYDFNPRLLGFKNYIAAQLFYCRRSTRLHEIAFADGSRVPREDLYHILDVLDKNTVAYPWEQGDVMVLDNVLTMHGRAPFQGKRRVLTAMTA